MKFEVNKSKVAGKNVWHFTWPSSPISYAIYKFMFNNIPINYRPVDEDQMNIFRDKLAEVNEKFNADLDIYQYLALRENILKDHIINNYHKPTELREQIFKKYNSGVSILKIANDLQFPPLGTFKSILISKGIKNNIIRNLYFGQIDPKNILSGRDLDQFWLALENDYENIANIKIIREVSVRNEDIFIKYFKDLGVELLTQTELAEEQTQRFTRAIATPDILFLDEVYINEVRVHWIDYKNYLYSAREIASKLPNKISLYNKKWNRGALCFLYSYTSDVFLDNTLLLNAKCLPVTYEDTPLVDPVKNWPSKFSQ